MVRFLISYGLVFPCAHAAAATDGIPFELVSNKPIVPVRVNRSEPLWFMLDSGAAGGTVIDRGVARALGLEIENERRGLGGAGEGKDILMGWIGAVGLHIGALEFKLPNACAMPLNRVARFEGRTVDGLLGRELFERYVVEIDYAARRVHLHEPLGFRYFDNGHALTTRTIRGFDVVRGSVRLADGEVTGDFIIDTGMRGPLILSRPFWEKHMLRQRLGTTLATTIGGGLAGEMKGLVGRATALRLGDLLVDRPIVMLSEDRTGVLVKPDFAGIIGGQLLREFRVVFDRQRQRLILEPQRRPMPPLECDMSGMFLTARGPEFKRFTVMSVIDGSPAAVAGIQRGDVVTSVDGRSADRLTLDEVRELLRVEGKTRQLVIERAGLRRRVTLKLRRLI